MCSQLRKGECQECAPSWERENVRKVHHSAQHCLPDGYTRGFPRWLSDHLFFLTGERRALCADGPLFRHTLEVLNAQWAPHPWDSPVLSPGLSHIPPLSAVRRGRRCEERREDAGYTRECREVYIPGWCISPIYPGGVYRDIPPRTHGCIPGYTSQDPRVYKGKPLLTHGCIRDKPLLTHGYTAGCTPLPTGIQQGVHPYPRVYTGISYHTHGCIRVSPTIPTGVHKVYLFHLRVYIGCTCPTYG